jgi:fumarylacetoacetate (FAA) hydrolase
MKLVTYRSPAVGATPRLGVLLAAPDDPDAGMVLDVARAFAQVQPHAGPVPATMLDLLEAGPGLLAALGMVLAELGVDDHAPLAPEQQEALGAAAFPMRETRLLAPVPRPPTLRDFYAFEGHVKAARALRGLDMIPEWYEIPVFYFSNPGAVIGPDAPLEMPQIQELDYELELACVIGRAGRDIPAEEAERYIAGYTIMNDWSARDTWRNYEAKLSMGPAKSKDFATSLGPWLATPDELEDRREGSGAETRHNLEMVCRVNGREYSRGNANSITHTFAQMIAWASRDAWLRPGDVLGSGTVGTGCILELRPETVGGWLKPGDVVEMSVTGLGVLRNAVVPRGGGEPGDE